ncbi:MAG: V-type ATPase subunit [Christensenellaceae bacterium]|jgi:V/A-type H+-transporting ATPase subunit C|nr:V-type ATPase subunit [Christensenellaceae bacterium]
MKDGLLFANGVAKSKENGLFKGERLLRMLESENLEEAFKILAESDYGNGVLVDSPSDFDKILDSELALIPEFIQSLSIDGSGIECFFLSADYFNLKALLKAKFSSTTMNYAPAIGGIIPFEQLKDSIMRENQGLNQYMTEAITKIENDFEIKQSPRFLDLVLDNAMYLEIKDRLSKHRCDPLIRMYFRTKVDCLNISSFIRSSIINADYNFFADTFMPGGTLNLAFFESIYPNVNDLSEQLKNTAYSAFSEFVKNKDLATFDKMRDDRLINIFKDKRNDIFSIAPIVGYYLAKINEITMLRMILVCKKNGVERSEIQKRLRTLYA